ncbi:conserved hypothetical protein [Trichinella spiralis]|uniref:hypothetical protein n=1 Tax=Trichinella spiralis TaxID=6334 RepID=UPI0001EFE4FB|nr:conserved hypothetical protein [Trichinella spiralis]
MASRFLTLENAIDYLETLPPEDQINAEVCQLPPCEDGNLTDEEHIEEDDLDEVMPLDVCGEVDVTVDSDRIVNEDDVTTNKGYGSRKWWWNLFSYALNMAIVAAWKLHMELHTATNDRLSHLQFRREITSHLLHARPFVRNHPGPRSHLPIRLRTSYGHYFQSCAQGRCAVCQRNCRNECVQCRKRLH